MSRFYARLVEHVKDSLDAYAEKLFSLKQTCLNALYKIVALVYLDTRNLMDLDNEEVKKTHLKHHLGIRVATLPRDIDIAWMPTENPKKTMQIFRRYNSFINRFRGRICDIP